MLILGIYVNFKNLILLFHLYYKNCCKTVKNITIRFNYCVFYWTTAFRWYNKKTFCCFRWCFVIYVIFHLSFFFYSCSVKTFFFHPKRMYTISCIRSFFYNPVIITWYCSKNARMVGCTTFSSRKTSNTQLKKTCLKRSL